MELLIYVVFLGLWFFINFRRFGFNGGSFLIFIYLVSSLAGCFVFLSTSLYDSDKLNFGAIVFHCFCLFLFLYPITYISNHYFDKFLLPRKGVLKYLYYIIFFFGIITFISMLGKLKSIMAVGDLQMARNMHNYGLLENEGGIINYLGAFGSGFSYIALYLFFYNLVNHSNKRYLLIGLLLCSLCDPLTSLSMVGRGGLVRWVFMVAFFYFSFRKQINKKLKKILIRSIAILGTPFILVFIGITVSRFSSREYPLYIYMLDYLGQSFIYFSYIFDQFFISTFDGRMNFSFLFPGEELDGFVSELVYTSYNLNTFSTFVGSFYKDVGFFTTFYIAFFFWLLFIVMFRINRNPLKFYKLVLFIVFSQIIVNGVFYYQYTGGTKIKIFILLIMAALFVKGHRISSKIR